MPLYSFSFTVPAGTSKTSPKEVEMKLHEGVVCKIDIHFPKGCHDLVHVTIWHEGAQIWPNNPDGTIVGDGETVTWREHYKLIKPALLIARCWSPSASYDHEIKIRINILPEWVLLPQLLLGKLLRVMGKLASVIVGEEMEGG